MLKCPRFVRQQAFNRRTLETNISFYTSPCTFLWILHCINVDCPTSYSLSFLTTSLILRSYTFVFVLLLLLLFFFFFCHFSIYKLRFSFISLEYFPFSNWNIFFVLIWIFSLLVLFFYVNLILFTHGHGMGAILVIVQLNFNEFPTPVQCSLKILISLFQYLQ